MRAVVMRMQNTPYVLEGGTGPGQIAYDLDRHSTDIDFEVTERIHIKERVRDGLSDADVLRPWCCGAFSARATSGHFPGFL